MNFWTRTVVYSPDFLPGSLTSRVADGLPMKSLISIRVQAISRTTKAHRIHGRWLTIHTHSVSLSEILHPPRQGPVLQSTVRSQGLCLELHTVSGILCVRRPLWRRSLSCSLLVEGRGSYEGRDEGVRAVLALPRGVLQAAGSLLQGRAGRPSVLGLLPHRAPPHAGCRLALVCAATPGAPLPHEARASWKTAQ